MIDSVTGPRPPGHPAGMRILAWLVCCAPTSLLAACGGERGEAPDAAGTADAAIVDAWPAPCDDGTSSVTGTGPDGPLTGTNVYPGALSGFCTPAIRLDLGASRAWEHRAAVIIAPMPVDLLSIEEPWSGTVAGTIETAGLTDSAPIELVISVATAATPEGPQTRFAATATIDADGWDLSLTVDRPYCYADTCL